MTRSSKPATCTPLTDPITTDKGTRIPGLRLGQQRIHALLSALLTFRLLPHGFANRDLRFITAELRGIPPELVTAGQMTYDACAPTALSRRSPTPTATTSPIIACTPRCS